MLFMVLAITQEALLQMGGPISHLDNIYGNTRVVRKEGWHRFISTHRICAMLVMWHPVYWVLFLHWLVGPETRRQPADIFFLGCFSSMHPHVHFSFGNMSLHCLYGVI